jgi:CelD/BcsL family acetyltransferase involved in cellulose biosynthesis
MSLDVLRSLAQLDALMDEWDRLAATRSTPVLEHEWMRCCAQAFHPPGSLRVVTVRRRGRLVAAAPLAAAPRSGIERLELIGMTALREPGGLIYEDDAALSELLCALIALGAPVTLERLEARSAVGRLLSTYVRRPGVIVRRPTASSLFVPVRGEWATYRTQLSSRITGNLPRLRRRAEKLGAVRVEVLQPAPDETPALLETVMTVEAAGWKGRSGSAMRARGDLRAFFGAYALSAARARRLRICRLWLGSRIAAAELAVVAYQRWWQLKIGYDDTFAELYPGLQLTDENIRYAFEQRLEAYEFLGSAAPWERHWNPEEREHELVVLYPRTPAALWGLVVDAGGAAARRVAQRIGWGGHAAHTGVDGRGA